MPKKVVEKNKITFLNDKDIDLDKKDNLGTKPYADLLFNIINDAKETPVTIGLFGGWGSGKSSIIKTIKNRFDDEKKLNTSVFIYDAWKYSEDAFRRTFLHKLVENYELKSSDFFNSFYEDKHEEIKTKIGLADKWWVYLILIFIPIIFINSVSFSLEKEFDFTIFVISLTISVITAFVTKAFIQYKISITKSKLFSPEQFEDSFKAIIKSLVEPNYSNILTKIWFKYILNKKIEKIVIVIDNIDRCHKDLAFELLLTIKNFLEQENVIFIVPVDNLEIKKHIKLENHNEDEFLRKLFNTTVTIKKFSEDDLFDFAENITKEEKINLPNEVISLISQKFSKNPRRIKQFLNILISEINLAECLERSGNIPFGSITKELSFLTKILLIREEWFDFYEYLNEDPTRLVDINISLEDNDENKNNKENIKNNNIYLNDDQKHFLIRTSHITPEKHKNYEVFFVNKDTFKNIPDNVLNFVISQDWFSIKKILKKGEITFKELVKFIDNKFEKDVSNRNLLKTTGFNIFSLVFKISKDKDYSNIFEKYFYGNSQLFGNVRGHLNQKSIKSIMPLFNSEDFLFFMKNKLVQNKKPMSNLINIMNKITLPTEEKEIKLLENYITILEDNPNYIKKISPIFSRVIGNQPNFFNRFKLLIKDKNTIKRLLSLKTIEAFIKDLDLDPEEKNTRVKIEIIESYHLVENLSEENINILLNKIANFGGSEKYEIIQFWLNRIKRFIKETENKETHNNILRYLSIINTYLWNNFNVMFADENYEETLHLFLEVIEDLYTSNIAEDRTNIRDWLTKFYTQTQNPSVYLKVNSIYQRLTNRFVIWDWSYSQQIIDKFNQITVWGEKKEIAKSLNLMLSKTNSDNGLNSNQIETILRNYLNSENSIEIIDWIKNIKNNPLVSNQISIIINGWSTDVKENKLNVIKEIGSKELLEQSVKEILENADCENIDVKSDLITQSKINLLIIRNVIKEILRNNDKDDEYLYCLLKTAVGKKWLNKGLSDFVISKVKPLLAGDKPEGYTFAIKILDQIEITNDRKELLNSLLREIKPKELEDEDVKKILSKLKRKTKQIK